MGSSSRKTWSQGRLKRIELRQFYVEDTNPVVREKRQMQERGDNCKNNLE